MSILERELELFLDREWPLWRQHEGGLVHGLIRKAFVAGFKAGEEGPSAEALGLGEYKEVDVLTLINAKPRKFKQPKSRKR
jgi:hypothetical protein